MFSTRVPSGSRSKPWRVNPGFVNPALCSMLGFSEKEMRKKPCVDFSPPEDARKGWVLFQQLRAGSINQYQLEKRYFRSDGSLFWGGATNDPAEIETRTRQLRRQIAEISHDLQALSHEQASKLKYLGVVAGLRGWCRELGIGRRSRLAFRKMSQRLCR